MARHTMIVQKPSAWIRTVPALDQNIGRRDSQLLFGEKIETERVGPLSYYFNGFASATATLDGYKGWVDLEDVKHARKSNDPTHVVTTRMTALYPEPNFKTRPVMALSFMSQVKADPAGDEKGFTPVKHGRKTLWVPDNHIMAVDALAANPVDVVDTAMMFNGSPYLYGGRTVNGIDCSKLVQLSLQRNGIFCPGDADMQENVVGDAIELKNARRGDIVYFPGHVGIMVDARNIINATVRHMQVVIEPLADILPAYDNNVTAVRRLPSAPNLKP